MVMHIRAKALSSFPFAADGVTVRTVAAEETFFVASDVFAGLKAQGLVEEDPLAEGEAPAVITAAGSGVTRVDRSGVAMEPTKIAPEDQALVDATTVELPDMASPVDDKKLVIKPATVPQDNDDHAFRATVENAMAAKKLAGEPVPSVAEVAAQAGGTTVQSAGVATVAEVEPVAAGEAIAEAKGSGEYEVKVERPVTKRTAKK